jgi:opacity protein-like surface antigen
MLKKTIATIFFLSSASLSLAVEPIIGLKLGYGELSADKKDDQNKYADQSKDENSAFGAIFLEAGNIVTIPSTDISISLGLEYIPLSATIDVDGSNIDAEGDIEDHKTIYALISKPLPAGGSLYGKIGYSEADIGTLKRNDVASSTEDASTTVLSNQDTTLKGYSLGVGYEREVEAPLVNNMLLRFEANYTDYDDVSVTSTETNAGSHTQTLIHTADADTTTFTISVAKKF